MSTRAAQYERRTGETTVTVELTIDGSGRADVGTGIGFLDHLLAALARHARFDLVLRCDGDLHVDDHHTAEDTALALGHALDRALGDRHGIARFGWALAPLDEALAQVAVDLSGRPLATVHLGLTRDTIGGLACENVTHVLASFATAARLTMHLDLIRGANDHHRAEAAFKALALALKQAMAESGFDDVPSTKEAL